MSAPNATRPRVVRAGDELRVALDDWRRDGGTVGFVPTLGALHAGHRSLIARARREDGLVLVSIFVNPLQFAAGEDLNRYPRDLDADLAICAEEGADLVFAPPQAEMWPVPPEVRLAAGSYGQVLEGALRPGHMDGVATVVAKLFNLTAPCRAYFGRKDAQQLALVRRMVVDLAFRIEVVPCDTLREPDGLAMSSRNAYLGPADRAAAPALFAALSAARDAWRAGEGRPAALEAVAARRLAAEPGVEVDYVRLVDADTFEPPDQAAKGQVIAVAARVGGARLIDNVILGR